MASATNHIRYVDGLRGVAVGLVLVFHAWSHHLPAGMAASSVRAANPLLLLVSRGYQGVSLFLVLSGFCLSYPLLRKRLEGEERWFQPSTFFARRCLRILPPYYVALGIFVAASIWLAHTHVQGLSVVGGPPGAANMAAHLLLVHNLTPYDLTINGSFWSLGLEWQWYWVFPLALVSAARFPGASLAALLALAIAWHVGTHDLWSIAALPARLFEFCCGIVAARLILHGRVPSTQVLLGIMVASLSLAEAPPAPPAVQLEHLVLAVGLRQPLWGIAFTTLLLAGYRSRSINSLLSFRPLVLLGTASYSIYLVHEPIVQAVDLFAPVPLRASPLVMVAAVLAGIGVGIVFHLIVERPCMDHRTWKRAAPALTWAFGWTDQLWERLRGRTFQRAGGERTRLASEVPIAYGGVQER